VIQLLVSDNEGGEARADINIEIQGNGMSEIKKGLF